MAPPTPVRLQAEIRDLYREQLSNPEKYKCTLKALTQLECTFRISGTNSVLETICIPFKRVFQRCLQPYVRTENGKKVRGERWINIEVTDASTNEPVISKHSEEIQRFLKAEAELSRWMEAQTELG